MLIDMLKKYPPFQELPLHQQEAYAQLADVFYENDFALYLTPVELTQKLSIGNKTLWQDFLNFEPVKNYIKGQMANLSTVASRKAFEALQKEATLGNVGAAKQIHEISGLMNSGDQNKTVVLIRVDRPKRVRLDA